MCKQHTFKDRDGRRVTQQSFNFDAPVDWSVNTSERRNTWRNKPSLWETNRDLAKQLVDPSDGDRLTAGSNRKVSWTCGRHTWEAVVSNRSKGKGCPYCSGQRATPETCLATVNPDLARELVNPEDGDRLAARSNKKVSWRCNAGHEWEAMVKSRSSGTGCPFCSGRVATPETCLATVSPELAGQLVDKSLATQLMPNSRKKVSWRCDAGHTWEARAADRSHGKGCPCCSGRLATPETCLATVSPELASQLVDQPLAKRLTAMSGQKVSWRCDAGHQWNARVSDRSRGQGCPECAPKSLMEEWTNGLLTDLGIRFDPQWTHDSCMDKKHLKFDAMILDYSGKAIVAIECQGIQHFKPATFGGMPKEQAERNFETQQRRDEIKRDFCRREGIALIEMHYTHRDCLHGDYQQSEFFKTSLLSELLSAGVIGWEQFSRHHKPWEPVLSDTNLLASAAACVQHGGI